MPPLVDPATHCERDDVAENCGSDKPEGESTSEIELRRERALWALAEELVWKVNQLDPSDLPDWSSLDDRTRRFYYHLVKHIMLNYRLVKTVVLADEWRNLANPR